MTPCEKIIRKHIQDYGSISVMDYMQTVLMHPKYGFNQTQQPIGADGHFITAPEISQIFGELLGVWAVNQWVKMGRPERLSVVELGPGRGTMMCDFLRASSVRPNFLESIRIHLVEINPFLSQIQRKNLNHYTAIQQHKTLGDAIHGISGEPAIFIANEYFDALPIQQFEKTDCGWRERHITLSPLESPQKTQDLSFTVRPLKELVSGLDNQAKTGSITERNPLARKEVWRICHFLTQWRGSALIIDYGYEGPSYGDTLQTVIRHTFCRPVEKIGEADLTAHVDFTKLQDIVKECPGLSCKLTTQRDFLRSLHIYIRLAFLLKTAANREQKTALLSGVSRLTNPLYMGTLFKVLEVQSVSKSNRIKS